jgi:hypothetical protein
MRREMEDLSSLQVTLVVDRPVPLWRVLLPHGGELSRPPFNEIQFLRGLDRRLVGCSFRAVGADRLDAVLAKGVDVEPTNAAIFADFFEKAWEYGDWPKVMLAFDPSRLDQTWREIPATTPRDQLEALQQTFPTVIASRDGSTLWLSRLAKDDPRCTTDYEVAYGRWIPGNPFDALRAVLLFVRPEDNDRLPEYLGGASVRSQ